MIYKYCSNSSLSLENLRLKQICFSHVDVFNDNLEFEARFTDELCKGLEAQSAFLNNAFIEQQKFRLRICCFSTKSNLENMWGYYANKGNGFCLGYDEEELKVTVPNLILEKVHYSDEIPTFDESMLPKDMLIAQTCHKKKCWQEEQEIRAIAFLSDHYIFKQDMRINAPEPWIPIIRNDDTVMLELPVQPNLQDDKIPYMLISPKNVLLKLKPKEIIVGRKCEDDFKQEIVSIAKANEIPWRRNGEPNE